MRVRALLGVVAMIVVLAACGESPDAEKTSDATAAQGSGTLSNPPIPLRDPYISLWGVGDHKLFLGSRDQAAVFDFVDQTWTELPTPPKLRGVTIGSVGSTVILVGLDCAPKCAEDMPAPVAAASLDLAADAPAWKTSKVPIGPRQAHGFGVAAVGERDGAFLFYINLDLVTVSPGLEAQRLPAPPTGAHQFCVVGAAVQALTVQQVTDPKGTSALMQTETVGARTTWEPVADSETTTLAAPNPYFTGVMCGPRGIVLALSDQSYEWDGHSWVGRPIPTSIYGVTQSVLTSDGNVVGSSGTQLVVLTETGWNSRTVAEQPPGVPPPILRITAVGNSVVVYDSPRAPNETGDLTLVTI